MKKVLIIADEFPPVGGPGVQRTLKFTKYLQTFNYLPYIFTRSSRNILLKDDSLLDEVPSNIEVIRTRPYDFQYKKTLLNKIMYFILLIPDGRVIWYLKSRKTLIATINRIKPDIIYSTSFPYSNHLLALYATKKIKNIKWVADFRDEWTNNPYFNHNFIRTFIERRIEEKIMKRANKLIANTPIMEQNFIKSYPFTSNKFNVIPNGYDKSDYKNLHIPKKDKKVFTITYTGSFYGSRKPDYFLKALANVVQTKSNIKVIFIGNIKQAQIKLLINQLNITSHIEFISYLPHKESIKKLMQSDISLLIEGKDNIPFYTGKVFEYMYLENTILAIIPKNGAAAELITRTNTGIVCDSEDISHIEASILKLYNNWENNLNSNRNMQEIEKYDRIYLTKQLVNLFNDIL